MLRCANAVGNYQDPQVIRKAKAERHKFGSFYYRFPHGESASDVVSEQHLQPFVCKRLEYSSNSPTIYFPV